MESLEQKPSHLSSIHLLFNELENRASWLSCGSDFTLEGQGIQKYVSVATDFPLVVSKYVPKSIDSWGEVLEVF